MHRFFIGDSGWHNHTAGDILSVDPRLAHQLRDVLHIRVGEHLVLFDAQAQEYVCSIATSNRGNVEVQIEALRAGQPESKVQVILYQGLLKSARFEMILEKGTELGVSRFVPTLCQRSMAGLNETGTKKFERWQRIVQEATEQCGRTHIPELTSIQTLPEAISALPQNALTLMPWEEEQAYSLHEVLSTYKDQQQTASTATITVAVFIGPEGGLTGEEVEQARRAGVNIVTLGTRILRAETAALATIANIMYDLES